MLYEFSLVTQHRPQCDNLGIGVLLAPVSCWCPRGRLAPLCYASLAGDGLLVATHRPPATPHTTLKIRRFYQTLNLSEKVAKHTLNAGFVVGASVVETCAHSYPVLWL